MVAIPWPVTTSPGVKPSEGAGRLINCYAEPLGIGARDQTSSHRVAGLASFGTSARSTYRGAIEVAGTLYAAFNSNLERWSSSGGASVHVGTLNGTKKGFFAHNNAATPDKVFVDPDGNIATFTTSTVTNSFDVDLPAVNSVCQLDGYFIFSTGSGQIWASDLNAVSVNALSFTTDQTSGGLYRVIAYSGRVLSFGQIATGVYSDAGTSPFPLAKVTTIQRGIAGPYCVTGYEENFARGIHFVGDDNAVYRLDGISPVRVSPPDLDGRIEAVSDKTTIEMCSYISRGHGFVEISCPSWTWTLDTNTGWWHEKAKYLGLRSRISSGVVYAFSKWLCGDTDTGNILQITNTSYLDVDQPIVTEVRSKPIQQYPQQIQVPAIWIDAALGVGNASGTDPIATDPTIEISWSDDGGQTYSTPRQRKLGRQSEGRLRIRVNQCGRTKSQGRIVKVMCSDPVHFGLMGGEMATELHAA